MLSLDWHSHTIFRKYSEGNMNYEMSESIVANINNSVENENYVGCQTGFSTFVMHVLVKIVSYAPLTYFFYVIPV